MLCTLESLIAVGVRLLIFGLLLSPMLLLETLRLLDVGILITVLHESLKIG